MPPVALAGPEPGRPAVPLSEEEQRRARWSLTALGILGTGSLVGVAFSPYLVTHWPLLLVGLSPLGRHLVLVAPVVAPLAFVAVVVVRRLAFYGACFELGRALGPWGIPWLETRAARFARFVRLVERLFAKAPRVVVLLGSGPTVSALAGVSRMSAGVFVGLASVSLVLRAALVLGFASWIREYIELALAWVDAWWLPATAVTLTAVVVYHLVRRRRAPAADDLAP